nr:FRG domain-containing protein [Vibrio anguillarum]
MLSRRSCVSNAEYQLIPSLGRIPQLIGDNDYLLSYELRLLDDFKGKAMPYLKHIPRTEWEWIFLAQHHGIPTR